MKQPARGGEDVRVLSQALGYCWNVAAADRYALPKASIIA